VTTRNVGELKQYLTWYYYAYELGAPSFDQLLELMELPPSHSLGVELALTELFMKCYRPKVASVDESNAQHEQIKAKMKTIIERDQYEIPSPS